MTKAKTNYMTEPDSDGPEIATIRRGSGRRIAAAMANINKAVKEARPELERFLQVKYDGESEFEPHPMIKPFCEGVAMFDQMVTSILHPPIPDAGGDE